MDQSKTEEVISMFLGLVIVGVVLGMIFNFFQKRRGDISLGGVNTEEDQNSELSDDSQYIVKKGDSLWQIAAERLGDGKRWTEIARENGLKNPSIIHAGNKLVIPEREVVIRETVNKSDQYTAAKGDSLWKIAVERFGDGYRWVDIYETNKAKLRSPGLLEIGMILDLPKGK